MTDGKISVSDNSITVVEENTGVQLKYKNIVIADATNQESISKMKEILANHSKTEIIVYLEFGGLILTAYLILYWIILKHLEHLFVNINNGDTPFTLENVKHIKKMAYLMIAAIILPIAAGVIFESVLKTDLDVGFEPYNAVEILFLFSMAYIFEYGYEIQLDSKGKIYGDEEESL